MGEEKALSSRNTKLLLSCCWIRAIFLISFSQASLSSGNPGCLLKTEVANQKHLQDVWNQGGSCCCEHLVPGMAKTSLFPREEACQVSSGRLLILLVASGAISDLLPGWGFA